MKRYFALLLVLATGPLVGCASLPMLSLAGTPDPVEVANGTQATVVVELRPEGSKPKTYQMPLEGDYHVQDVIEKSGAKRKFRRMFVSLVRTSPEGRRHKMECEYDHIKRKIAPQFDYAVQPGDYIVISEDTTTMLGDMLSRTMKPLGVMGR